jgi:putative hemolysin
MKLPTTRTTQAQILPPSPEGRSAYPAHRALVPPGALRAGRYSLRFAQSDADLEAIQRLRFDVFNLELDEGLRSSYQTGLDRDAHDSLCHHLMVVHEELGRVVGTYRLMTSAQTSRIGFYSAGEYDLSGLPVSVQQEAVEVGRACVAREHRNGRVIHLLWRGLARYLEHNGKRYLFGCCSVPTLDPVTAWAMHRALFRQGKTHPDIWLRPLPATRAEEPRPDVVAACVGDIELPPLFQSYLKLGARVCSSPALDREFGVTDFLVLLDLERMEPAVRRSFFARVQWTPDLMA